MTNGSRSLPDSTSLEDADQIRGKVLLAFERAERLAALVDAPPEAIQQLLTLALVGAGTVGSGNGRHPVRPKCHGMALAHDFRHIDPRRDAEVLLYEAKSRKCYPRIRKRFRSRRGFPLAGAGRQGPYQHTAVSLVVMTQGIVADGQRVFASTVLWSAGVLVSPAGRWLGAAVDKSGRAGHC